MSAVAAAITVGGGLISSSMSANAAENAANTQGAAAQAGIAAQERATDKSLALQRQALESQLKLGAPYTQAGQGALSALYRGLGLGNMQSTNTGTTPTGSYVNGQGQAVDAKGQPITSAAPFSDYGLTQAQLDAAGGSIGAGSLNERFTPSDLTNDPSYKWRLEQGMKNLQASAAAKGTLMTGQGLRDIVNYGQGAASQEYQNAYDRFVNNQNLTYNRLASLAGLGQNQAAGSGNALGAAGSGMGGTVMSGAQNANNLGIQAANAAAAGQMGQANAWAGGLSGGLNNWMTLQALKGKKGLFGGDTTAEV